MKKTIFFLAAALLFSGGAHACTQLTPSAGIGTLQPTTGGGVTAYWNSGASIAAQYKPSISNWGPPTNPGQQGPTPWPVSITSITAPSSSVSTMTVSGTPSIPLGIGQQVAVPGYPAPVKIAAFVSGGGGAGTYTVSNPNSGAIGTVTGTASALGYYDDAIAVNITVPFQTYTSGQVRWNIDAGAISGISAGSIKAAINGGAYQVVTTFPEVNPPDGAHGEACVTANVSDLPAGQIELRWEICPVNGWCRELSNVQNATVAIGSSIVTIPAHGQAANKFVTITGATDTTDFPNYSQTTSGTTETYAGIYCTAGSITANSYLLLKPISITRSANGFQQSPMPSLNCSATFSGFINGSILYVTSALSGATNFAGLSPMVDTGGTGNCPMLVVTTCPAVTSPATGGGIGVYTLNSSAIGNVNTGATFTAAITGGVLTLTATSITGTIANGQTIAFPGMTQAVTVSGCTGSGTVTCTLSADPTGGTGYSGTAAGGTPATMFAGNVLTNTTNPTNPSGLPQSFVVTYLGGGAFESFPDSNRDHMDGSLFSFVNHGGTDVNAYSRWFNPVAGSSGNPGTSASLPADSINTALTDMYYTNNGNTSGPAQAIGSATVGPTTCTTFFLAGNVTGASPMVAGDVVFYDGPVGSLLTAGAYYIQAVNFSATDNITLAETPGGPCINDTTATGSAHLFRDFSTTTFYSQCSPVPSTNAACAAPVQYSITGGNGTQAYHGYNGVSYWTVTPDTVTTVPHGYTVAVGNPGSTTNLNVDMVHFQNETAAYPFMRVHVLKPVPAGTSPPTVVVSTAELASAGFTVTASASVGSGTMLGANYCIPFSYYGGFTIAGHSYSGSNTYVSAVTNNGDGTTSITFAATGDYSPLTTINACRQGEIIPLVNPWHFHTGKFFWADGSYFTGSDETVMEAAEFYGGSMFGTGQFYTLFATNSAGSWLNTGLSYASLVVGTTMTGVYTKCAEADAIIINSQPCADFSDTHQARFTPASGWPSPQYQPTVTPFNDVANQALYIDPDQLPKNFSYLWLAQYQCGATTTQAAVANWKFDNTVNQSPAPGHRKGAWKITLVQSLNAACSSTPANDVELTSGSHEDCNQYIPVGNFINTVVYDGWYNNAACYGIVTLINNVGPTKQMFTGWIDAMILNSQLVGQQINPSPLIYQDISLSNPMQNYLIRNSSIGWVRIVPGPNGFGIIGNGDVVFDNVACPAGSGVVTSSGLVTFLNSPGGSSC